MQLADIFKAAAGGCDTVGCMHGHVDEPMFLHPRCHPSAGTWVSVDPVKHTLRIVCKTCKTLVVELVCP